MRRVEKWKWRIRWGGKTMTTRVAFTEEEIRRQHPDAVRVEGSCVVVEVPEQQHELDAALQPRGRR